MTLSLSIETSCDETSVCVLNDEKKILSHIVYSQEEHKKFDRYYVFFELHI